MPKYVIERKVPGAGGLSLQELQAISRKSCGVIRDLQPPIPWLESSVVDDGIYCVYLAPNADALREHAKRGGFPAHRISQVRATISPETAGV